MENQENEYIWNNQKGTTTEQVMYTNWLKLSTGLNKLGENGIENSIPNYKREVILYQTEIRSLHLYVARGWRLCNNNHLGGWYVIIRNHHPIKKQSQSRYWKQMGGDRSQNTDQDHWDWADNHQWCHIDFIKSIYKKYIKQRANGTIKFSQYPPRSQCSDNTTQSWGKHQGLEQWYVQLLGELQYVANAMCPDITYAVNRLASYTANPSLQHQTALKRILRYLSGTSDYCITYKALPEQSDFFHSYADTAYANADENRSTTGYVFLAGEGAITWSSKQQISMALSSTEAEYIALSKAGHKVCWLRNLYMELGLLKEEMPTTIYGDNEGSITMAKNPQFHKRLKHIVTRWHWIRELVQDGTISVESCWDPEQTANILTKALPRQKHSKHVVEMGLTHAWGGVLESKQWVSIGAAGDCWSPAPSCIRVDKVRMP